MFLLGLGKLFSKSKPLAPAGRTLRLDKQAKVAAAYDAAQTTDYNVRHWKNSDDLSADSANSVEVRRVLRSRSRYESNEANSFLKGIVSTLANDCIGTGPRLQVMTEDREVNSQIEQAFSAWSKQARLAEKLRTMRTAKAVDGEAFAIMATNSRLKNPVQLDLKLVEAEQVSTPFMRWTDGRSVDGIRFDGFGNPIEYHLLKSHPGDTESSFQATDFDPVDAEDMLHIFRCDRPGQHRGIPETTTSLPLCAMLRDYTQAVLSAARTAAKHAAVIETDSSAQTDDGNSWDPEVEPFDAVVIDYDMMTSLPFGWHMRQFKAEQPTTSFVDYRNAQIGEIARPWNMPLGIALGNSSGYNYASGRLDLQLYFKTIFVERSQWECNVLDRILLAWFDEAVLIPGLLPDLMGLIADLPHTWFWDGREHVDPSKNATANKIKLESNQTTLAAIFAEEGKDWETEMRQRAREIALGKELSLNSSDPELREVSKEPENTEETDGDESQEETEAKEAA